MVERIIDCKQMQQIYIDLHEFFKEHSDLPDDLVLSWK